MKYFKTFLKKTLNILIKPLILSQKLRFFIIFLNILFNLFAFVFILFNDVPTVQNHSHHGRLNEGIL